MKNVLTYGTFDLFHYGHLELLRRAKSLGDRLYVGVSTDAFNLLKNKECIYSYTHRSAILRALRYVDVVFPETCWEQKADDVKKYHIDVFVMGDDWKGYFDEQLKGLCKVIYLPRTKGISSSFLREYIRSGRK